MRRNLCFLSLLLVLMFLTGCGQDARQVPFAELSELNVTAVDCVFGTRGPEELSQTEQAELIELLRQIRIGKTGSEPKLEGGTGISEIMFELHLTDGSTVTVSASGDQFILNGTAYTADYELCEQILDLYSRCIG